MKTNQEMVRYIDNYSVIQRTKDGFFDSNHLLTQWNSVAGNTKREMKKFLDNSSTLEFISALKEDLAQSQICDLVDLEVVKYHKGRNTQKGKTKDQVWMHPFLFTKFAMWINPRFEVKVIKFVYDEMIRYRNEAGDAYKEMSFQVQTISPAGVPFPDIIRGVSKAVNIVVYGKHERMIRNKVGEESKVRELLELEKDVAKMIKRKFIKNLVELRAFLLQEYRERHEPALLIV